MNYIGIRVTDPDLGPGVIVDEDRDAVTVRFSNPILEPKRLLKSIIDPELSKSPTSLELPLDRLSAISGLTVELHRAFALYRLHHPKLNKSDAIHAAAKLIVLIEQAKDLPEL